jgi:hypothetical protein
VAEAGLEWADGETTAVVGLLAESFDGWALHDEHWGRDLSGCSGDERGTFERRDYLE